MSKLTWSCHCWFTVVRISMPSQWFFLIFFGMTGWQWCKHWLAHSNQMNQGHHLRGGPKQCVLPSRPGNPVLINTSTATGRLTAAYSLRPAYTRAAVWIHQTWIRIYKGLFYIYIYYVLLLLVVDFSIDNCDKMTIDVEGSVVNHTLILTINYCHCHCQILLSQEGLVSETPS